MMLNTLINKKTMIELSAIYLKKKCKSILCLNSKLPRKSFFRIKKPIIAADGAANLLLKKSIIPDLVIGDLDSVNKKDFDQSTIIHIANQNFTDFQKALFYLKQHKLLPTLVCGVAGGALDHIIHNIEIIIKNRCLIYSPPIIGIVLNKGDHSFKLAANRKVSLFGTKAQVSSIGLKWELDNYTLDFPKRSSLSNLTIENTLELRVLKGEVLLLVYEE